MACLPDTTQVFLSLNIVQDLCSDKFCLKKTLMHESKVNTDGLRYPVKLRDIKCFEQNNPELAINVLAIDGTGVIYPLHASRKSGRTVIWMLLFTEGKTKLHIALGSNFK